MTAKNPAGRLCFPEPRTVTGLSVSTALCLLLILASAATARAQSPDYDTLDAILARNVRNGFVDYNGVAAEPGFDAFIARLGALQPTDLATGSAQLAFYINAYNALAMQGILNGRSPSGWWGRRKFFGQRAYRVLGETISLQTLEHERLVQFDEPRIHFAIVCASLSCPRLSSRAYRPATIDEQLHAAATGFINDPTRNRFDPDRRIAFLSKIFSWYEQDFIAAGGTLQRYLARFAADARVQDMLRRDEFDVRFVDYDWALNGRFDGVD